jgi:hypothetical protein
MEKSIYITYVYIFKTKNRNRFAETSLSFILDALFCYSLYGVSL